MKKVIALAIALVLLGSIAMAEAFDVSSMGDEELEELQFVLSQEVVNRGIEKTAILKQGTYVGGKDIPVGQYYLDSDDESAHGLIVLEPAGYEVGSFDYKLYDAAKGKNHDSYYISLDEGDILTIPYQFKLTITTGIKFE